MRKNAVAALAAGLCLLAAQSGAAWASAPRLERMSYAAARKTILRYGWKPLVGGCEVAGSNTCSAFPEISACSGVAPGQCGMVFVQRNRCLYLGTTGGQPDGLGADTRVETVNVRPGPCGKS